MMGTYTCTEPKIHTYTGTEGADTITPYEQLSLGVMAYPPGSRPPLAPDIINGLGGDDVIDGAGGGLYDAEGSPDGADHLYGDDGNDRIFGQVG